MPLSRRRHLQMPGAGAVFASLVAVCMGCGGGRSTHTKTTPHAAARREPAAAALRELDAGLRALRLGGPEAGERAAASFERAVALDATLWEAWHDLGVARAREGDDRRAATAYGRALGLRPKHTPSLLARAEALRRLGRRREARTDYEAALAVEPDDLGTRLRLASLLRE